MSGSHPSSPASPSPLAEDRGTVGPPPSGPAPGETRDLALAVALLSMAAILFELCLTRVFAVVLFAAFAHLALAVAMMGIALGAVIHHLLPAVLPASRLLARLGWLALAQGGLIVTAGVAAVWFPLTHQSLAPPETFVADRMPIKLDLIDPLWFALLLPLLTAPFACIGLGLAAVFQHHRRHFGLLYGADLVGGAAGALAFVPLLERVAAPDLVFVALVCSASAGGLLLWRAGDGRGAGVAAGVTLVAAALTLAGASSPPLLAVRYPAGFADTHVVWERWTPIARLAIHERDAQRRVLLDNTSSSEIVLTRERRAQLAENLSRSLVFQLHDPPARVAVLAASAGPDVAAAQHYGFTGIVAVDLAPDVGDLVAARYPDAEANPWVSGGTLRVTADARSAILHDPAPFDIIQASFANLHGANGILADAWSPALLGTREAFALYLDRLDADGTISFARGSRTSLMARAAAAALEDRGVAEPWRHLLLLGAPDQVLLVKPRPFTRAERDRIHAVLDRHPRQTVEIDPLAEPDPEVVALLTEGRPLTDDHPFAESREEIVEAWADAAGRLLGGGRGDAVKPELVIYHVMLLELLAALVGGAVVVGLPAASWWTSERRVPPGTVAALVSVACLGYGYLAVEIVLIHQLVLILGHPTWAVTTVVGTMLASSGCGSMVTAMRPPASGRVAQGRALGAILILGALQAAALPAALEAIATGWPVPARVLACVVVLTPLGVVMGMPLAIQVADLRGARASLVPLAWALNGWTSVVASLGTVVVSRLSGFRAALWVALLSYGVALLLVRPGFPPVGSSGDDPTR